MQTRGLPRSQSGKRPQMGRSWFHQMLLDLYYNEQYMSYSKLTIYFILLYF